MAPRPRSSALANYDLAPDPEAVGWGTVGPMEKMRTCDAVADALEEAHQAWSDRQDCECGT